MTDGPITRSVGHHLVGTQAVRPRARHRAQDRARTSRRSSSASDKILKSNGKLVADLDGPRKAVEASRDYLVGKVEPQAGWMTSAGTTSVR